MPTSAATVSLSSRVRLWQAFLSARVLVAVMLLALLVLQATSLSVGSPVSHWMWWVAGGYLLASTSTWLLLHQRPLAPHLGLSWLMVVGLDIACIFTLQALQTAATHYTPLLALLALPILMAATLGSLLLALGTTAGVTLLLLGWTTWHSWAYEQVGNAHFLQTAATCAAYFLLAYVTHQLARRLEREEQRAHHNQQQAHTQGLVNDLIIAHLSEGVLVLDAAYRVQMANPAARELLGNGPLLNLGTNEAWEPLRTLVDQSFALQLSHSAEVNLLSPGSSPIGLYVRTWLTTADGAAITAQPAQAPSPRLCVMFLDDLREAQARLRTEKLAAMGRMSAAVAHEIRNPLAAIMQANALLIEELAEPTQQRLAGMVQANADRLARIAEEILDIARVRNQIHHTTAATLQLDSHITTIWEEWRQHAPQQRGGYLQLCAQNAPVEFEAEHLRRVIVNLLDNALRYISDRPDALQLITGHQPQQAPWLQVWSDGAPLDASVQRHLFEPFFSSQSRSTGLGLYMCRELCQRYGASLHYQRVRRATQQGLVEGNAFTLTFQHGRQLAGSASLFDTNVV